MSQLILQPFRHFTYVTAYSRTLPLLHLRDISFSKPSVALPMSQLILEPFRYFTYVTSHSTTLPSLHLRHSSFSNPSVASPTSHLTLQPLHRFSYVIAHSPTLPLLHLHHSLSSNPSFASPTSQQSSFSKLSDASPTSQLILQPFPRFTYVTGHSQTLPLLHLHHILSSNPSFASPISQQSSFSKLSVASPTSQLILQLFRRFTYVTGHSPILPLLHLRHSSFSNPSFASPASQLFT